MKIFKTLVGILTVVSLMFAIPALACEGPDCDAQGYLGQGVAAGNIGYDADGKIINKGAAGSIGVGAGGSAGLAAGYVKNGTVSAETSVVGGGAAGANDYKVNLGVKPNGKNIKNLQGVKVGSQAGAVAQTGGSMDVKVKGDGGLVGGAAGGIAVQGTLSGSIIADNNNFESHGLSVGVAGQGSLGSWSGKAGAWSWDDKKGKAGFDANIFMSGGSYSESYRYIDTRTEGVRTEGFGSNVGSQTHVTSEGSKYSNRKGYAKLNGGYVVGGGAASLTVQESMGHRSMGGAVAGTVGAYSGSGDLGCNFDGSATGFTSTSVTTFDGMNGSINSASAGMEVSAQTNAGGNDPR